MLCEPSVPSPRANALWDASLQPCISVPLAELLVLAHWAVCLSSRTVSRAAVHASMTAAAAEECPDKRY